MRKSAKILEEIQFRVSIVTEAASLSWNHLKVLLSTSKVMGNTGITIAEMN